MRPRDKKARRGGPSRERRQKDQGADDSLLTFYGDPSAKLTKALGLVLDHPGPMAKLGYPRSKRFAACRPAPHAHLGARRGAVPRRYVVDGVVKAVEVSEKPDDPAGDDFPESSCVENMLLHVAKVSKDEL